MILRVGIILGIVLVLFGLFIVALIFGQDKLIYYPRQYSLNMPQFEVLDQIVYQSDGKQQVAYQYPKDFDGTPDQVWLLFGGNGSVALNWLELVEHAASQAPGTVFLMVDYPGYGLSHGKPSPSKIYASVEQLLENRASLWNLSRSELADRSRTMGHSLGAAVALHTAAENQMPEAVAIAPFTTMHDMAVKQTNGFIAKFLRHPFDNKASVDRLFERKPPAKLTIYHGESDSLIPVTMGKSLAERVSGSDATFIPVPRAGHNDIVGRVHAQLLGHLTATSVSTSSKVNLRLENRIPTPEYAKDFVRVGQYLEDKVKVDIYQDHNGNLWVFSFFADNRIQVTGQRLDVIGSTIPGSGSEQWYIAERTKRFRMFYAAMIKKEGSPSANVYIIPKVDTPNCDYVITYRRADSLSLDKLTVNLKLEFHKGGKKFFH